MEGVPLVSLILCTTVEVSDDYQLGQQLAQLIAVQGEEGLINGRIISQIQDHLAADTSLLTPLRDLLQRPAFRMLFSSERRSQSLGARDALLQDLAQTYSPTLIARLDRLVNGCLGLADVAAAQQIYTTESASHYSAQAPLQQPTDQHQPTSYQPQYIQIPQPVHVVQPSSNGATTVLIALISVLGGALIVGIIGAILLNNSSVKLPNRSQPIQSSKQESTVNSNPPQNIEVPPEKSSAQGQLWASAGEYKFGHAPDQQYPSSCGFSTTDANGQMVINKSSMEFWACRDEGGSADGGYGVSWSDGKRTNYTFGDNNQGKIIGTNGQSYPMTWSNDSHNGDNIIVIQHQDGAVSWIPGHVN